MKRRKFLLLWLFFAIGLPLLFYLRNWLDIWRSERLDAIAWFLFSPVLYLAIRFNLPDPLLLFLCVVYYFAVGIIVERLFSRVSNKRLLAVCLLLFAAGLCLLHWFAARLSAEAFGEIIRGSIERLFKNLFRIK